ncbi:MAG: class I SAM-dependent methyltransferase [Deltaproteobacteria bacterium]|nr:class I SAM-dependent methyltransferase [Deltaproteobacteria bacterium]
MAKWYQVPKFMDASLWDRIIGQYKGDPYRRLVMLPTILGLLPSIRGKKVLDIGTGNGFLIPHLLRKKPRIVVGIDKSSELLSIAKTRLPQNVRLIQGDITKKFVLDETPFDVAICNFVLNEIENLFVACKNIARQFHKNSTLIVGVLHPFYSLGQYLRAGNKTVKDFERYFSEKKITEIYRNSRESIRLENFSRPLSAYINALLEAGFIIEKTIEPQTPFRVVRENPCYKPYKDLPVSFYFLLRLHRYPVPFS